MFALSRVVRDELVNYPGPRTTHHITRHPRELSYGSLYEYCHGFALFNVTEFLRERRKTALLQEPFITISKTT